MKTIDIYLSDESGQIVACEVVNFYRPTMPWKAQVDAIVNRALAKGYTAEILYPIDLTGVAMRRTKAQLDYDRSMQPIWQGSDLCGGGTAMEPPRDILDEFEAQLDNFETNVTEEMIDAFGEGTLGDVREAGLGATAEYPKRIEVESSTKGADPYIVTILEGNIAVCQCKGYSYRQRCRHQTIALQKAKPNATA